MHSAPSINVATSAVSRVRWAGLAGRAHGEEGSSRQPFVFLHGLTFDRRMWDPILDLLPPDRRAIAFDLPGHGGSPPLRERGLAPVVEAIHDAVLEADLRRPILVGHSIGGPLAAIYAASYPVAAVVSIDAPILIEPFAQVLSSILPQLTGDGFGTVWAGFQQSWRMDSVPPQYRHLLQAGERGAQEVVLSYQADLIERPVDEVIRWQEDGYGELRRNRTAYVTLHAAPVEQAERDWLTERLPQAEIVVWPVGHHFPHLAHPNRLVALLTGLAATSALEQAA